MPSSCAVVTTSTQVGRRQLALGQDPADLVVEDLGGGAGDGVEPGLLAPSVSHSRMDRPVRVAPLTTSIGREGVHMHARDALLHRPRDVEVRRAGQVGVDAALHADLHRADVPGLLGPVGDLVEGERVGVGVGAALREGAEAAAGVADVGEVDVPGDDVGDVVADGVAGAGRRRCAQSASSAGPVGVQQGQRLGVGEPGRVVGGRAPGPAVRRRRCAPATIPGAAASRSASQSPYTSSKSSRRSACGPRCRWCGAGRCGPRRVEALVGLLPGAALRPRRPRRARPVSGSASARTCGRSRGSSQGSPRRTNSG